MPVENFIILASLEQGQADFAFKTAASSAAEAHDEAARQYRKQMHLPAGQHVFTVTAMRGESGEKTVAIFEELMKKFGEEDGQVASTD